MIKKSNLKTAIILLFLSIGALSQACEIEFEVSEKFKKKAYTPGEEIVVEVTVAFDHRDCNVDISETKFNASGAKITGATKWTQSKSNTYHRKLKVKILESKEDEASIICKRTCDKEGGYGKIILKKA